MRPYLSDFALVFDLDDTLYLERDFAWSGFCAVGDWIAQTQGVSGFAELCQTLLEAGERGRIFNLALAQCGLPETLARDLIARYRTHQPQIALCADARRCLDRHGPGLALITDGPEDTQRTKIAALELTRWFDLILPTGQWGAEFSKPHPRAYEMVQAARPGQRCVYIGDNGAKDFVTPNQLGWLSVAIHREGRVHPGIPPSPAHAPHHVIESLDQLGALLADVACRQ